MYFDKLYLLGLKYLNFRPRSEKEIRDYLKRKLNPSGKSKMHPESDSIIDLIVHKLKQQRFLNDEEFTKMWVRSRTSFKPKGWRLIKLELQQKGISNEIIKNYESRIKNYGEHERPSEETLAIQVLELKKKRYKDMSKQERFNKAGSMLARRGFGLDAIKRAIDAVFGKMV